MCVEWLQAHTNIVTRSCFGSVLRGNIQRADWLHFCMFAVLAASCPCQAGGGGVGGGGGGGGGGSGGGGDGDGNPRPRPKNDDRTFTATRWRPFDVSQIPQGDFEPSLRASRKKIRHVIINLFHK